MANIVITGANRGIGLALTQQYLAAGHQVWALCRSAGEALPNTAATVIEGVDVSDLAGLPKALAGLASVSIDVLINNAGILRDESLGNLSSSQIQAQFQVNALAPLVVTDCLLPQLSSSAKVAMITSRMGSMADNSSGGRYGYRMSKAALNAASVSLAQDVKARGIAVAILHPGWVQTEMVSGSGHVTADESAAQLIARIDALTLETSGTFWHANGEILPW